MSFKSRQSLVVVFALAVSVGIIFSANVCQAQKKYDPYHPKVKKICDKAIKYLKSTGDSVLAHRTISSLAIVEYYKRYEGRVPTDVPVVEQTVKELAAKIDGDAVDIFGNQETYFPALAFILMAEYDAKKYRSQCIKVLKSLVKRQRDDGGFTYKTGRLSKAGDTSQSQFGALAFYVARQHNLPLDPNRAGLLLQYFVQFQARNGTWAYNTTSQRPAKGKETNSIHSASLSSVYLLSDLLRLSRRVKTVAGSGPAPELDLPKNVSVYVPEEEGDGGEDANGVWSGEEPVVRFDKASLSGCKNGGNQWYAAHYRFPEKQWNSYFIYALERYCYFKEQAEGKLGPEFKSWYDDGVDYIQKHQQKTGAIESANRVANMPLQANTALYVLFMVRASEVISLPPVLSEMNGGEGFAAGNLTQRKDGTISSSEAERSLQGLIDALSDKNLEERQLQQMTDAMKRAVRDFKKTAGQSRGETTKFLKRLIKADNYYRRLIAIRFLSGEQDMDYVPALIYAVGDPNLGIALKAHNGLRLTSRKFDTFNYRDQGSEEANLAEMQRLKAQWTKWFLEIRPDAELFE